MLALTQRQEQVLETTLYLSRLLERPPTTRQLATHLELDGKTIFQHLGSLERKGAISREDGRIRFTKACHSRWPALGLSNFNRAVEVILHALHCSTHFAVDKDYLCAPRASFSCQVDEDVVTTIGNGHGLTSYFFLCPSIYRLGRSEILDLYEDVFHKEKVSLRSDVYQDECTSLLVVPVYVRRDLVAIIKVESKIGAFGDALNPDQPVAFTKQDQRLLTSMIKNRFDLLRAALTWTRQWCPNPQMSTAGWGTGVE